MKIALIVGGIIIGILLALLFVDNKTDAYVLGDKTFTFPQTFLVTKKAYVQEEWASNGYCGDPGQNETCESLLLVYPNASDTDKKFIISYPKQFGFLTSDTQECFREEQKTITLASSEIQISQYYHNIDEITYTPENIENGQSPYNCDNVTINDQNFHHLQGCSADGICAWTDKKLGVEEFYKAIEQIE